MSGEVDKVFQHRGSVDGPTSATSDQQPLHEVDSKTPDSLSVEPLTEKSDALPAEKSRSKENVVERSYVPPFPRLPQYKVASGSRPRVVAAATGTVKG